MNWILKIAPKQLSQIDTYLRSNYPWLWATRIHFTVYVSVLLALFSGIIGLLAPVDIHDPLSKYDVMDYFEIFMFPAVLFGGYIIFQLCLFSVEKRKGKGHFFRPLIVFPTLMLSIVLPILMPFTIAAVVNQKVAHLESKEIIDQDLINVKKAQYFVNEGESKYVHFESERDYRKYWANSYENGTQQGSLKSESDDRVNKIYWHDRQYKLNRPRLLKGGERYYNYYSWRNNQDEVEAIQKAFYNEQNLKFSLDSARKYLSLLRDCQLKYAGGTLINVNSALADLENNNYSNCYSNVTIYDPNSRYNHGELPMNSVLGNVEDSIGNIMYAQNNFWNRNAEEILLVTLFVSFIITLILYIFKHVNWKQFLLNLLILAIYFTIAGIIEGFGRYRGDFIFSSLLVLVLGSLLFVHRAWSLKSSSVFTNQMAIIAFVSIPFLPLMVVGYMDEVMNYWPYYDYNHYAAERDYMGSYTGSYYDVKERLYWVSFWMGIGLFYSVGLPYLKKVFVRLMSLPKSK